MPSFLKKNKKGQAVLFIILVFQVLFILFAMSLNVAMVVYDKINLQNSLDLASYYGAKKQSEVLNAMAHINYQMRQNWKLLSWRYRILGTVTQDQGYYNPNKLNPPPSNSKFWCPQNRSQDTLCETNNPDISNPKECRGASQLFSKSKIYPDYCDQNYFTCISSSLWKRGMQYADENSCVNNNFPIQPIESLPVVATFLPEAWIGQETIDQTKDDVSEDCPTEGALNWLMTQLFLTHFRLDQKDRKTMIKEIYNKTLKEGKDLDNENIFEGTEKVFYYNLTKSNQNNVKDLPKKGLIESQSFKNKDFEEVFEELNVRPILYYLDFNAGTSTCQPEPMPHFSLEGPAPKPNTNQITEQISTFITSRFNHGTSLFNLLTNSKAHQIFAYNRSFSTSNDLLHTLSLSFYKKPDQILYYGLKAKFNYKPNNQIFSLTIDDITFQASSFAKAFGASFGPQPEQSDPFIPTQNSNNSAGTPLKFVTNSKLLGFVHQPNYSRWPGDQWGLIDKKLHDPKERYTFLNKQRRLTRQSQQIFKIEDYFHALGGIKKDPLARPPPSFKKKSFIRMMEWMAVYPDLYDVNHYSILANYHETYFPKICQLLTGSPCNPEKENKFSSTEGDSINFYVRGDFGWPDSKSYIDENQKAKQIDLSIAPYFLRQEETETINVNQLEIPNSPKPPPGITPRTPYRNSHLIGRLTTPPPRPNNLNPPLSQGNLFYPWLARQGKLPDGLLSSWFNPHPLDYQHYDFTENQNLSNHFLTCTHKALKNMPVSSSCVGLGRTGYSVKLVSCESVKSFKPPPSDIDEFCPP